jgi:membrane protease YdiL (CAAX protease family)
MSIRSWIQKHPLIAYFILAYAISWAASLGVMGPKFFTGGTYTMTDTLLVLIGMVLGPLISGLVLTRLVDGKPGMQALSGRMRKWNVSLRWYAAALLIFPAIFLGVLLTLSRLVSPIFTPGFFWPGIVYGLFAGFTEEIGWTGFAVPRMRAVHGALLGAGILGLLHGLWHICADFLGSSANLGAYWFPFFAGMFIAAMPAMRILMVWVYNHTGSLPLAQLMHASFTGSVVTLSPAGLSPANGAFWYWIFAAAIWIVVLIVIAIAGKRLGQRERR